MYHRDLKMENIMVSDYSCLKIADFGTGTDLKRSRTMAVGTPVVNPDDARPVREAAATAHLSAQQADDESYAKQLKAAVKLAAPELRGVGYLTSAWDVFQSGALLFMMTCTDHIVAKQVRMPGGEWQTMWSQLNFVWQNERRLFGGGRGAALQTFREQCEASRDPATGEPTNILFWEYWERGAAELGALPASLIDYYHVWTPNPRFYSPVGSRGLPGAPSALKRHA